MRHPDYVDDEMRELLEELSRAIVPRGRRQPVYRTNWRTPYYTKGRYSRI